MSDVIGILESIGSNASLNAQIAPNSLDLLQQQDLNLPVCCTLLSNGASHIKLLTGIKAKICCFISAPEVPEEFYQHKSTCDNGFTAVYQPVRCQAVA